MNVVTKTLATTLLTGAAMTANAAYIPTFTSGQTTTVAGATVFDFEGGKPANYSGAGSVLQGSVSGQSAAPALRVPVQSGPLRSFQPAARSRPVHRHPYPRA